MMHSSWRCQGCMPPSIKLWLTMWIARARKVTIFQKASQMAMSSIVGMVLPSLTLRVACRT